MMFLTCKENMIQADSPLERYQIIAESDFFGVDLMGGELGHHLAQVKSALSETGLKAASVYGQLGQAGTSLIGRTAAERAHSLDLFKKRIEATAEVGAEKMIFVPKFGDMEIRREAAEWMLITMLDELATWAKDIPVTLVMEPLNSKETRFLYDPQFAVRIVEKVNSSKVETMVDTYHMEVEQQDMELMIRETGHHLAIVHLSDVDRLLPGQGRIDFQGVLRALREIGYEGPIGFECKAATLNELKASVHLLQNIWEGL